MDKPRLRFAPSPTGYLHIGGARTALFNWLWARKTGGTFVLRIEDTDVARNTRESVEAIFTAMKWLGLDWDEGPKDADDQGGGPNGPYFQSKRLALYREHADKLIRSGHAYRCYATKEDIDAARMALPEKLRASFHFQSPWRDKRAELDKPHVVRIKAPSEGEVSFDDLVFGTIKVPAHTLRDEILIRENGMPLYNFGCVVDDLTMGITHVIRGKDHIINTSPQVLMYRAFGAKLPTFGHLPMLMKNSKEKLSKRDGAVGVGEYEALGYLPDGLLSYLVRFGWSFGDEELFTKASLAEKFDWDRVSKSDGIYDFKKCKAINQKFIAKLATIDELAKGSIKPLAERGLVVSLSDPRLVESINTVRERAETLVVMAEAMDFYFRDVPAMDEAAVAKFYKPEVADTLEKLAEFAATHVVEREARTMSFGEHQKALEEALRTFVTGLGIEMKAIGQPARVALTGRGASPDLASVMLVLGPSVSARRLRDGAARARAIEPAAAGAP
jgi:glutamyl-tRNA synthetase